MVVLKSFLCARVIAVGNSTDSASSTLAGTSAIAIGWSASGVLAALAPVAMNAVARPASASAAVREPGMKSVGFIWCFLGNTSGIT